MDTDVVRWLSYFVVLYVGRWWLQSWIRDICQEEIRKADRS